MLLPENMLPYAFFSSSLRALSVAVTAASSARASRFLASARHTVPKSSLASSSCEG
jgi:hypothetical protein